MSITDELREIARKNLLGPIDYGKEGFTKIGYKKLLAIADRIDAEHEADVSIACRLAAGLDNDALAKRGYIKLPVDADGVPIRIGDEMEGVNKYDSLRKVRGKVITVSYEVDGIVDVAIQAWSSDGKSWNRAYLDQYASVYRHHHAPTVEDVLRQFAREIDADAYGITDAKVAEFAAKLRLAGDE